VPSAFTQIVPITNYPSPEMEGIYAIAEVFHAGFGFLPDFYLLLCLPTFQTETMLSSDVSKNI